MVGIKGHIHYEGKQMDDRVRQFFRLHKQGKIDQEIEELTGCTHMQVYNWRKRYGIRNNLKTEPETFKEVAGETLSYIAGFLDGDGCVSLRKRKENIYFAPVIEFSNNNMEVLEFIRKKLGLVTNVNLHESTNYSNRGNRKMSYKFAIKGWRNCLHAAKLLVPYSSVKKKQLYILIKYLERRTEKFFMNTPYDDKDWYFYNTIVKLNSCGRTDVPRIRMEKRFNNEKKLNDSYLAGFFDAEGCCSLLFNGKRISPFIGFTNTDKKIIGWIKENYMPRKKIAIRDAEMMSRKIVYDIRFQSFSDCHSLAKRLYTFSIVKKKRLGILIMFIESRMRKPFRAIYDEKEKRYYEEIRLLNKTGIIRF
jgi:hypothetical protein